MKKIYLTIFFLQLVCSKHFLIDTGDTNKAHRRTKDRSLNKPGKYDQGIIQEKMENYMGNIVFNEQLAQEFHNHKRGQIFDPKELSRITRLITMRSQPKYF